MDRRAHHEMEEVWDGKYEECETFGLRLGLAGSRQPFLIRHQRRVTICPSLFESQSWHHRFVSLVEQLLGSVLSQCVAASQYPLY